MLVVAGHTIAFSQLKLAVLDLNWEDVVLEDVALEHKKKNSVSALWHCPLNPLYMIVKSTGYNVNLISIRLLASPLERRKKHTVMESLECQKVRETAGISQT